MSPLKRKEDFLIKSVFVLLVFLIPSQLAYHFWPQWAFIFGIRIDYFSPTLYLTDILIALLLLATVLESFLTKKTQLFKELVEYRNLIVIVVVFIFINIFFSLSPILALYKWVKLLEFSFLACFIAFYKKLDFKSWFLKPILYSSIVFSTIGVLQFIKGSTLGVPFIFFGERSFSTQTPGIALVSFLGRDYLRSYSTFPHPNALAGFLGIVLIFLLFFKDKVSKRLFILTGALGLSCLLFTFSLGTSLSLFFIGSIYLIFRNRNFKKISFIVSLAVFSLSLLFLFLSRPLLSSFSLSAHVAERLYLDRVAFDLIKSRPLFGIGLGNYIVGLNTLRLGVSSWLLQPVHNIFLLIFSETGITGLLMFYFLITKAFLKGKIVFVVCLLFMVLTGFADHYWITLQQDLIMLTAIIGFSLRKNWGILW